MRVLGSTLAPQALAREIRSVARDHFHKPVRVRMLTEVAAEVEPQ